MNCSLNEEAWKQSTLSVNHAGIGLRDVTNLCYSSFLGSVHSVADLLNAILPQFVNESIDVTVNEATAFWQSISQTDPPLPTYLRVNFKKVATRSTIYQSQD